LHLRRSEYKQSLDYLERARRVAPENADIAKLAGWAYYGMNKMDQAVAEWKRALALKPDGVFLSNGPGDPEPATYAIENIRKLLGRVPVFGICLGHQLCGLALGGKTFKLRFGHHGSNHPVKNLLTGQIEITAQNHGFCVDPDSLPSSDVEVTHLNLNDNTNEGLRHRTLPLFSVQYHPEASPGPHDSHYLFTQFTDTMKNWKLSGALRRGQAKA